MIAKTYNQVNGYFEAPLPWLFRLYKSFSDYVICLGNFCTLISSRWPIILSKLTWGLICIKSVRSCHTCMNRLLNWLRDWLIAFLIRWIDGMTHSLSIHRSPCRKGYPNTTYYQILVWKLTLQILQEVTSPGWQKGVNARATRILLFELFAFKYLFYIKTAFRPENWFKTNIVEHGNKSVL